MRVDGLNCCGWQEISGLSAVDIKATNLREVLSTFIHRLIYMTTGELYQGAVLFTSNVGGRYNYGESFAKLIEAHNLGKIRRIPKFKNPNTGRYIYSYVWYLNSNNIRRFMKGV